MSIVSSSAGMIPRASAIAIAREAGYHNDRNELVRVICGSRASRATLDDAWHEGVADREAGITCDCFRCTQKVAA